MIPLREGLIGKKNISFAGGVSLEQFDIVKHGFSDSLYIVILDPKLINLLVLSTEDLEISLKKGIILYYWGNHDWDFSWLPLEHYDKDLNYIGWNKTTPKHWDIKEIYRMNTVGKIKVNNLQDIKDIANVKSLKMLTQHFTKIYNRK